MVVSTNAVNSGGGAMIQYVEDVGRDMRHFAAASGSGDHAGPMLCNKPRRSWHWALRWAEVPPTRTRATATPLVVFALAPIAPLHMAALHRPPALGAREPGLLIWHAEQAFAICICHDHDPDRPRSATPVRKRSALQCTVTKGHG